jgi:iron complex transport system substrate-binding protein
MNPLNGTKVPGQAERPATLTADTLGDTLALGVTPVVASNVPAYMRREADGVRRVSATDLSGIRAGTPDVILGTKEADGDEYGDLSKIAPTILGEGDDWKLNLRLHGEALGRTNDAEKLLIDYDRRVGMVRQAIRKPRQKVALVLFTAEGSRLAPRDSFAGSVVADAGLRLARSRRAADVTLWSAAPGVKAKGGPGRVEAATWWGPGGIFEARAALADLKRVLGR